ncbi:MAG TPA: hypothetical protein VFJ16_31555 [Longimicrobium sp.]|nr:hypothetical protein [Longimicrobium sp.]
MHIRWLLAPVALILAAAPARAQSGNQSDIPIPPISGAGSGSFLGPGLRAENEMFGRNNNGVVFRNAKTGCAIRNAAQAYRDSVATAPRTPSQAQVQTLLGALDGTADPAAVESALAHGADPASDVGRAASALANALNGLLRNRGGCSDDRNAYTEAPQWQEAIRAFNDYVRTAPDSMMSPPAPQLVAIHDALQSVISHALSHP